MANLVPYDDGEWKSFTAVAGVAITGGCLYMTGSYTNTVAASETYDYREVLVTALASGQLCAGLALYNRASGTNNEVALLRRGVVLAQTNGTITASAAVAAAAATADGVPTVGPPTAGRNGDDIIGRALQTAVSGNYAYVLLNI